MPPNERLFLLDGMALAYRAYFAFISRPLINSKGVNTSAIFGFVSSLMKILEDEKPEHIAVVFDTKKPTFRHEVYKEYKATREKMPEDMSAQMDKLKEVVRAFNIPLLEIPGYEADDVIGTLAKQAEKEQVTTYMVTGDKDFMQLISPLIKMYKPGKSNTELEILDESAVNEKFGVPPDRVIDVLGLIGDKSDNVPGVPGVGEKTAIPLIQKYGSIENLYEHIDEIPQKGLREKLKANKDLAFLSKRLVTISTAVPVNVDFHQLRSAKRDTSSLVRLFGELEFRSLLVKLRETEPFEHADVREKEQGAGVIIDFTTDRHDYHCIITDHEFDQLVRRLEAARHFALSTMVTPDIGDRTALCGFALALKEREAFYVPVTVKTELSAGSATLFTQEESETPTNESSGLPLAPVLRKLKPILESQVIKKIGHNIKHMMLLLNQYDIKLDGIEFDPMVASYVLRADGQHTLEALCREYFDYKMLSPDDSLTKGKSQKGLKQRPLDTIMNQAAEAADFTLRSYAHQLERLKELDMIELCNTVEFPLISVLARMEIAGITLDLKYLKEMAKNLDRQITRLIHEIHKDAGEEFNINSTQQLGEILFKKINLPTVRKTKTGFSTDANVLETLRGMHPIIENLLEYRHLTKLKSTYVDALPELVSPRTGRLHTSFNQTVAATGRLSGSDPNLQNIPIRTDLGRAIRKAFVPAGDDTALMSADYSQIELRVMAHISGDEGLVEAFRNHEDIHTSTAAKVFGVAQPEINRDMRRKAKEVNFGIMYGIGPFGLASRLEITQAEAKEIISRYFERFPKVQQYIHDTIDSARRRGYVSTLLGRRRYLPEINSRNRNIRANAERQAINMPIQGTAADMIKIAMVNLDREFASKGSGTKMLLQVHDELVFEVPLREIPVMTQLVVERMRSAMPLNVPVEVEIGTGRNWLEAH